MTRISAWDKELLLQSPFFEALHAQVALLDAGTFPGLDDLNSLLGARAEPIVTGSGKPLRFVAQAGGKLPFEKQYEPRCHLDGEVMTRQHSWHDLFNALVWLTFPRTKAAINLRHYQALLESRSPAGRRGAVRDVSTLFDESGVIVACADSGLSGLLTGFRWQELFWQRRAEVSERMGFHLFGHGLYEKALNPYTGMTGQGLVLAVEAEFFGWPLQQRLAHLDGMLADYLHAPLHCRSTRELNPVPLLGVPGWTPENSSAEYYENTDYFRPGRSRG